MKRGGRGELERSREDSLHVARHLWHVTCGTSPVARHLWHVTCGTSPVACEVLTTHPIPELLALKASSQGI